MMKKAIKKLLAALLAVAMVCAMAIPAFAYNPGETKEDLNTKHDYGAFQIFEGVISKDNETLSDVNWGQNITEPDIFLANLKNDPTIGEKFETAATAQDVLAVISKWHDSDDNSIAFARVVCHYLYPDANANPTPVATDHTGGFNIPKSGYYLIVDTSTFSDDDFYHAYNSFFLLNVPQTPYVVLVNHKVVKPTVEKEVYDNNDIGSTGGWGSSADHAINEPFQFRLIAKLPASENNGRAYDYYKEYAVCFTDTLSAGITFDNLDTVEIANVDGSDSKEITDTDYTLVKDLHEAGLPSSIKLSIDNVKTCAAAAGLDLNDGATITVTYTAHLNDKAAVNTADGASNGENKNSVYLQYSNNPRIDTSLDHTTTSEVRVYTYQLNNTKYHDEDKPGNELEGAGFRLYSDEACNNEIKLKKNNDGTYSRDFSTGASGVEMISDNKGQFNVKGLDAGTYYLKETTPPKDYNACADKEIVISATHDVNHVSLSGNLSTTIINKKDGGITLPSTGGIGTTIFYVVGGGLMVAAIVLLVTKKRMENK
ncbi:SpaH/EbpB family LPXTG-anchored major pilin [Faecalibacterium sp.]|uniref:SpaH/EbpB family LPXTG-anchored major pilin n=1 Tax=Faecalibacterium sp. TaxID=1971605 RepID=UPI003AF1BA5A